MSIGLMSTRSGREASQQPGELNSLIDLFAEHGVTSYLEIGARHGDTFYTVMRALPSGSKGMAVDLPGGPWGSNWSKAPLQEAVLALRDEGYDANVLFGDSQALSDMVRLYGPFDAVLIDADHRYEAVKADFEAYNAPITAVHDIAGHGLVCGRHRMGVPDFWDEIKGDFPHREIIDPADERPMGIGVLFT